MGNTIANIVASFTVVALVTTMVLPGRQTPQVIKESSAGLSNLTYASLGMH